MELQGDAELEQDFVTMSLQTLLPYLVRESRDFRMIMAECIRKSGRRRFACMCSPTQRTR